MNDPNAWLDPTIFATIHLNVSEDRVHMYTPYERGGAGAEAVKSGACSLVCVPALAPSWCRDQDHETT